MVPCRQSVRSVQLGWVQRVWACLSIVAVLAAFAAPASAQVPTGENPGRPAAESPSGPSGVLGTKDRYEFWRAIRKGGAGKPTAPGIESAVLINSQGEQWRQWRMNYLTRYGQWVLAGVLGALALFFLIRGRMRIAGGRTGKVIPRFSLTQRIVHWYVAILFIALALSGLIILLGKTLLIPLIGKEAYATTASAAKQLHDLMGPIFIPGIVAMFLVFLAGNFPHPRDIKWVLKGGGFFGGHASSRKYNFGEKAWFWWSFLFSAVLCVSGLMLLFPGETPGREALQWAGLAHAAAAVLVVAFSLGHIYLATIGMEGALEGMTRGTVDENWAKEHHDIWYEDHKDLATRDVSRAEAMAAAKGDEAPAV